MAKIAWFSENDFTGYVPRNHLNMRTDYAWICASNGYHHNIFRAPKPDYDLDKYDLGIVIPPKNKNIHLDKIRAHCNKLAFMQEGPSWLWEDYDVKDQLLYLDQLKECDFLLCHNNRDINYFSGLYSKNIYVLQSIMIEDEISKISRDKSAALDYCLIPGNACSWYGGGTSTIIARELNCRIYMASMGRQKDNEELYGVTKIPYLNWFNWQVIVRDSKYMVSLMPTFAAGTAPLNAAYWGIPCIAYDYLDTVYNCHPYTSCSLRNLGQAKKLATRIKNDSAFYEECSKISKEMYNIHFREEIWVSRFNKILKEENVPSG